MRLIELDYSRDSAALFSCVAQEPWSIFLDSGYPLIDSGRYDIVAARPYRTFLTCGKETRIASGETLQYSGDDPFTLVKRELGGGRVNFSGLPFAGGALGYFSYDLGRRMAQLPMPDQDDVALPDMAIGMYDWAVVVDHHRRRTWLIAADNAGLGAAEWQDLQDLFGNSCRPVPETAGYAVQSGLLHHTDMAQYRVAFDRIKRYIRAGDCYQVNLTQRFSIAVTGDSWGLYQRLRRSNPAPYACFFRLEEGCILSSSPERFIAVTNDLVESRPIKGTIRRSAYAYEDKALAVQLLESKKDRRRT